MPSLQALHAAGHEILLAVTQPDRPGHRLRLTPPPVKEIAVRLGVDVYQPEKIREAATVERLRAAAPELMVVVAYGQIIPRRLLELPPRGIVNVHASLLPRWRGAAPVQYALLAGDEVTGVTIMQMDEELDHGPILAQRQVEVERGEDAPHLTDRLAQLGAEFLVETIARLDEIEPVEQDDSKATLAPRLRKEEGELEWSIPAAEIVQRLRAYRPWPGVTLPWRGRRVKVLQAYAQPGSGRPGEVLGHRDGWLKVATGDGVLVLMQVQLPTKKPMPGRALVAGGA